jgi:dTDP-4-amino-4,6-dideoxygalactose transaminase
VEKSKRHIYNQFVIRVSRDRDSLRDYLMSKEIGCEVYYPLPLHIQQCFSYLGYNEGDFPISAAAARSTLAIPIYPDLTFDQLSYVAEMIAKFFTKK